MTDTQYPVSNYAVYRVKSFCYAVCFHAEYRYAGYRGVTYSAEALIMAKMF